MWLTRNEDKPDPCEVKLNEGRRINTMNKKCASTIFKSVIALAVFASCAYESAQGAPKQSRLTAFCGFKAGENQAKIKAAKGEKDYNDAVRVRTPFRKFKNARLRFSSTGELVEVDAVLYIDKMKPAAAKKELDDCCKELAKYDGLDGLVSASWVSDGSGLKKELSDGNSAYVQIQGDTDFDRCLPSGKATKGAFFSIAVSWDLDALNRKPFAVTKGDYVPGKGVSRREFIEKAFGVKFGEDIFKYITKEKDDSQAMELSRCVIRKLSSPICGFATVRFDLTSAGRLCGIDFLPHGKANGGNLSEEKARLSAEASLDKVRSATGKWLGIEPFEAKDTVDDSAETKVVGKRATFEEDDITVTACTSYYMSKKTGAGFVEPCELNIGFEDRIVKKIKGIIVPSIDFSVKGRDTLRDAIDFLAKASKGSDGSESQEGTGIEIVLSDNSLGTKQIPRISAKKICLHDALKLVCDSVGLGFEVYNGRVNIAAKKAR